MISTSSLILLLFFFEFEYPERIPKSSGSGVRSGGLFSVGIRSEMVQLGRSENPEFPNPENIDLLSSRKSQKWR